MLPSFFSGRTLTRLSSRGCTLPSSPCVPTTSCKQQARHLSRLPHLPYSPEEGIRPVLSPRASHFHYDVVHRHYCTHLNRLLEASGQEFKPLEDLIVIYREFHTHAHIFNAASMAYNHTFMWLSMTPLGAFPSPWMDAYLRTQFGSIERFKKLWKASCLSAFGSSWCWLVDADGRLEIINSANASNPYGRAGLRPLLVIDLWEHAYALDYGQNVEAYVDNWMKAINWEFAELLLKKSAPSTQITPHPATLRLPADFEDLKPIDPDKISPDNEMMHQHEQYMEEAEDE